MVASVQNRSSNFSPTILANVRIAEFDLKQHYLKVLIAEKVKIFVLLVFTLKVQNL